MAEGALSHLKVVDLTHHIAGPFCTKLLAGFGAGVIKVEKPGTGDGLRQVGPYCDEAPGLETGIPFLWLNAGKRSITLNLAAPEGRDILLRLIHGADILIENFAPGTMKGFGLGFDVIHEANPRLVMTSISNFGQTGSYKDYQAEEIVEYALAGLMQLTGRPDRPPLCSGPAMTQYTAGIQACIATMLAIWHRRMTGVGQHVDVSIQEASLDNIEVVLSEYFHAGKIANRTGDEHPLVPWKLYPCQDGYAAVIGGPMRHWPGAASMFEDPRLLESGLQHVGGRMKHREEVAEMIQPWLSKHGKKEIYHAGQQRRMAFGYLAGAEEVLRSPQHEARGFFVDVDHPVAGTHRYCGAPFRSSANVWRAGRAPLLGEHTGEIMTTLGYTETDVARLRVQQVI